jgi:hypothetical protein
MQRKIATESVRASRAGHIFHEQWAARRSLQLIFPRDGLCAIAIEGFSTSDDIDAGSQADEIADLTLYYGTGDTFKSADRVEALQFKYRVSKAPVTAAYLKKTLQKFCATILGYEAAFSAQTIDRRLSFAFVTNAEFSPELLHAIAALKEGEAPTQPAARRQLQNLERWCQDSGVDAGRLFAMTEFHAGQHSLPAQKRHLRRLLTAWSGGADGPARIRLHALVELVVDKAGPGGAKNNLITRENVLDALGCDEDQLFPVQPSFLQVEKVVARAQLAEIIGLVRTSIQPVLVLAEGGVGKTVMVQSLAAKLADSYEIVVYDCFGGGAYRSDNHPRHLPTIGLTQLVNELAARGLCDPLLPGDSDMRGLPKGVRSRLKQASDVVRQQSKKHGVLLIIDAADNAQVEADLRKEEAFPHLLLSSLAEDPVEGVMLLLTARPHRTERLVGRSAITPYVLEPFTDSEARAFLAARLPGAPEQQVARALARSGRNARVLAYLIDTWQENVAGEAPSSPITVEQIIAQRCHKVVADLNALGWTDAETRELLAALALLPPPIPLTDLAGALGWPPSQVNSAVADLAPMIEIIPAGAIFRDEPTEMYVHQTYSSHTPSQQAIAQRLAANQSTSPYAAEALPGFLVAINDSDRAYALANDTQFPTGILSDYGRRRLTLVRRQAAFRLAVKDGDTDRVLKLMMLLAQVVAANERGDRFIRRAPGLGVALGDKDVSRRLFHDRSGWRGARDARLAIAYCFTGDLEEASFHQKRAIRWINWHDQNPPADQFSNDPRPEAHDFAAVMFLAALEKDFKVLDRNLSAWGLRFALSTSEELLALAAQHESLTGGDVLTSLARFAGSVSCKSFALKVAMLARPAGIAREFVKAIAVNVRSAPRSGKEATPSYDHEHVLEQTVGLAAATALLCGARAAAARILASVPRRRPSGYDYKERHSYSAVFAPALLACLGAWVKGRRVGYADLLPHEAKLGGHARRIADENQLRKFLEGLKTTVVVNADGGRGKTRPDKHKPRRLFDSGEVRDIAKAIEIIRTLIAPLEEAMLEARPPVGAAVGSFLTIWSRALRSDGPYTSDNGVARRFGFGIGALLLEHAEAISAEPAQQFIDMLFDRRFFLGQKLSILGKLAQRQHMHDVVGGFAARIAEDLGEDESIDSRGEHYARMTAALVPISIEEARTYYRKGLTELDQIGGDDFQLVYGLLRFSAAQRGGLLRPELAQRLMNLCQIIFRHEPHKFGWTLFARAMATSVGSAAVSKLIRWHDQDVAEFSYALPQLACFMTQSEMLDPKRAAVLLAVCEDHGWHDWQIGAGLAEILDRAEADERRPIFVAVYEKLLAEVPDGGWESKWQSLLGVADRFPTVVSADERAKITELRDAAKKRADEYNSRNFGSSTPALVSGTESEDANEGAALKQLADACDPTSASAIDGALREAEALSSRPYLVKKALLDDISQRCPYDKRLQHFFALCEVANLAVEDVIERLAELSAAWRATTAHLAASSREVIDHLFAHRGSQLFETRYGNIDRQVKILADLCGDRPLVMHRLSQTAAHEQVDLSGQDWLDLATALIPETSPAATLEALELMLAGPAARIADGIGEGAYRVEFTPLGDQTAQVADVLWHLLADPDAYVRWPTARAITAVANLGLMDDLRALVDRFDVTTVPHLASADYPLSFQNAQQWLLMGLTRASLSHANVMRDLHAPLLQLALRTDVHVIDKLLLLRCLEHVSKEPCSEVDSLRASLQGPPCGFAAGDRYKSGDKSQSGFAFEYEFAKTEIGALARLFGISHGEASDVAASEIVSRWPGTRNMDDFPGRDRYRHGRNDRIETYREHIQRHAVISAGTRLSRTLPVVRDADDASARTPWDEWLARYDLTFKDGSFLADHKDEMPAVATASFVAPRVGRHDVLHDPATLLSRLGMSAEATAPLPIYGSWTSPEGVHVRIVSGLARPRGAIKACTAFARRPEHELWIPLFDSCGDGEEAFRAPNPFEPLIWDREALDLGVDQADRYAAPAAAARPRLGLGPTQLLELTPDDDQRQWFTRDRRRALWSAVWGEWRPNPDYQRELQHNGGDILWADQRWLETALHTMERQLVFQVSFVRRKPARGYDDGRAVKAVYVLLRLRGGALRSWHARTASKPVEY